MNRIKVNRLLLSGLVTFLVFIVLEIVIEYVLGYYLLGRFIPVLRDPWLLPASWGVWNRILNLSIALVNCIMLIWLYAALRPMFGVGPRTALIAGAFVFYFVFSSINFEDLSIYYYNPLIPYQILLY